VGHRLAYAAQVQTRRDRAWRSDNDVPISESEQFYIALKDVGVETVLVRYPREGHGRREPKHIVDLMDRSIAWYERLFPVALMAGR
jgi:dipeptidyl aminopeptidase/acylaminoacyl peptidase